MAVWTEKRQLNAEAIWDCGRQFEALRVPSLPDRIEHAAYKCYMFVRHEKLRSGWDRDRIMNEIADLGVPCYTGSCSEVYMEKAFDGTGWRPTDRLPVAKELGETSLMFLVHPTLTQNEITKTVKALQQVMATASK